MQDVFTVLYFVGNRSVESSNIYKNTETRLKRLRNKLSKDANEKRVVSKNDKSHVQGSKKKPIISNMTTDKLIQEIIPKVLYEEMDWEPTEDEEIILEVLLQS